MSFGHRSLPREIARETRAASRKQEEKVEELAFHWGRILHDKEKIKICYLAELKTGRRYGQM